MPPFLASIGVRLAAVAALGLVLVALWWRMGAAVERAEVAETKVAELGQRVIQADAAVKQATVVNQAMRDAILRQNTEIQAAKAEAVKLEAAAAAARRAADVRAAAGRAEDTQRRARLDTPSPAEMNAVLRASVGTM